MNLTSSATASIQERAGRYVFCGTVRRDASRHRLPRISFPAKAEKLRGIAPFGVRTFLPYQRFRAIEAILRPSKIAGNIPCGGKVSKIHNDHGWSWTQSRSFSL